MLMSGLPRDLSKLSPTVVKRWGFVLLTLFSGLLFLLQIAGCAPDKGFPGAFPLTTDFTAGQDSLGLDEFLALPRTEREQRRRLADQWLARANGVDRADAEIRALSTAAGLAPDNPDTWLRLANRWRWIGDYVRTSASLDSAAAAVRKFGPEVSPDIIRDAQRRTALTRAWLHYDRAEYHEAQRWVRAGEQFSPGDIWIRQIKGLVEAALGRRSQAHQAAGDILRNDAADPDADWVLAILDRAQGRYREAFRFIAPLRPDHEHSAECFRDKAEIAEQLGEWSYARRWYIESAHALPFNDLSCLTEINYTRLEPGPENSRMPFWLAFDRYYTTGSLSAYTAFALHRFDTAVAAEDKEFWAGQVVNAAGILLRKDMHPAWSLRARGLVFAEKGLGGRGLKDLERAAELLAGQGKRDAGIEAGIGRLLLLAEDQDQALPHLRAAVALDAGLARAWSDLGLCLIMTGESDLAEEALGRAITLEPELAAAWYNRGLLNLHAGNLVQAESDLNEAARLAPGNQEITKLLQQVRLRRRPEN